MLTYADTYAAGAALRAPHSEPTASDQRQVLSLLALLVQKYQY